MPPKALTQRAKPGPKKAVPKDAAKKDAPKSQPKAESKAKATASVKKSTVNGTTKPEATTSPKEETTTTTSKKRARVDEPTAAAKPAKRARNEKTINTPPTQILDIYVFGTGDNGELGLGHVIRNGKKPKGVQRPRLNDLLDAKTVGVVQIAVGGMHCAALSHDNKIYTWGVNDLGALGRDTKKDAKAEDEDSDEEDDDIDLNPKESTPTAIPSSYFPEGVKFTQLVASDSATFALTTTGSVYGWGAFSGSDGVIGFTKLPTILSQDHKGPKDIQRTPIQIPELKHITSLAAGGNHILALDKTGNAFTWGCGEQNQLGRRIVDRHRAHALVPSQFSLPKRKIKGIACGGFHSFAIDDKDRVFSWGLNNFGQTGVFEGAGEANAVVSEPVVVDALKGLAIKEIEGGHHHSIACTEDGKTVVWGRCDDCQMGVELDDLPAEAVVKNAQGAPTILAQATVVP
ncbi:Protein pim1, partial [Lachnellula occidentalis]